MEYSTCGRSIEQCRFRKLKKKCEKKKAVALKEKFIEKLELLTARGPTAQYSYGCNIGK